MQRGLYCWVNTYDYNHGAESHIKKIIFSLSWELKQSPCSAKCGKGTQNVSYSCVQTFTQNKSKIVVNGSNCTSEIHSPETLDCLSFGPSCTEQNYSNAILTIVIIVCISLILLALYPLVMKVIAHCKSTDPDATTTATTIQYKNFNEISL